ncbi:MAG: hypothetical protein J7621_14245 [Niastella sp.]|nr:hypothetical protein [Niastella sp.]
MKSILLFLAFSYALSLAAQDTATIIEWSEKKLTWEDFREDNTEEKYYKKAAARINSGIRVRRYDTISNNQITVAIYAVMHPYRSWVRKRAVGNGKVLAHEQDHFEITELFARKLRKALSEETFVQKSHSKKMEKLIKQFRKDLSSMQYQYDQETSHGTNEQLQRWWHYFIINRLEELNNYKNAVVQLTINTSS